MTRRSRTTQSFDSAQDRHASPAAGFTFVELLVVLAILTLVTGTLVAIFYQVFEIPRLGNAQLTVDSDLRNAGLWLVRDGNQAWQFTSEVAPLYGTFHITRTTNATATVTYGYRAADTTLWRVYETASASQTRDVARHIADANDVQFTTLGSDKVLVSVTATVGQGAQQIRQSQTFTITMRTQ